jgi:hypothetical protein
LFQLNEKREELTRKLKPFEINFTPLINNLLEFAETNDNIAKFKEIMSFRHFNQLSKIIST